jgi:hypothetical protein
MDAPKPARQHPLLGHPEGPFRFELETAPDPLEEKDEPFLPLADSERHARTLLARLSLGSTLLARVALRLPRSVVRPGGSGRDALTTPQIEDQLARARAEFAAVKADGVARLLEPGPDGFRSLPVIFCKKTRASFHPPCPACGTPLADCRDDAFLRDHGLPERSTSAVRYLKCPACPSTALYTTAPPSEERPKGDVKIRRRTELVRDWRGLVRGGKADFPCAACEHRAECYPAGDASPIPAETRLVAVSYYEFQALPLEAFPLHFDEAADLLGGADWAALRERVRHAGTAGRDRLLEDLDAAFSGPGQFLSSGPRLALEALWLKLSLFAGLARAVRAVHAATGRPHLGLGPHTALAAAAPRATLPARWAFSAKLVGLGSSLRVPTGPGGPEIFAPAPDVDSHFVSPLVSGASHGKEYSLAASVRSATPAEGRTKIEGVLSSDRVRLEEFQEGDAVRIVPTTGGPSIEGLVFWGVLGAREERAVRFSAELPAALPKVPDFQAGVALYRRFGTSADLYALGLLLFRAVLVNDGRDFFAVEGAVQRVLKKLELRLEGKGRAGADRVASELARLLDEEEAFEPAAMLHEADARATEVAAVPSALWSDVLRFGFRLLTSVAGFSFDDSGAALAEAEALESRARIELFQKAERDREIAEACAQVLQELQAKPS